MSTPQENRADKLGLTATTLLAALGDLINEVGARDVSLRAVARRAGVSHAAPGHCFGDMEGMLAAYARQGFDELGTRLAEMALGETPPLAQLRNFITIYVDFAVSHPAHFDVMFRIGLNKTRYPDLVESASQARSLLAAPAAALTKSSARWSDPEAAALEFWALAHGLSSLAIDGQIAAVFGTRKLDDLVDRILDALE